ncbi:MAG: RNA polymerase sigma factor [Puniceicoccales bacterium]|jgi:RNA polymerase sigma-70 factor (ECF subfamily)|nr:RNA polymerase sigma factor [Puniceicoccales bacterium]
MTGDTHHHDSNDSTASDADVPDADADADDFTSFTAASDDAPATTSTPNANTTSTTSTTHNNDDETDVALMHLVGTGDTNALRMLIARWQGPLLNFFYRSTHSIQTSEDLSQSVFIRLHRCAPAYHRTARFSSFLFYIARNILINEHRRIARKPTELYDPTATPPEIASDDDSVRRCAEIEEAFAAAVTHLPENQRTALLLHKQQDLGYEEIAAAMDATVPLVKTWLFRGRQKLREILKDF